MPMEQFEKHFTQAEASAELPFLRQSLQELYELENTIENARKSGASNGGGSVPTHALASARLRVQEIMTEIDRRGIQIKDVRRGLVDFPHMKGGREVYLCWVLGEDSISYWHELSAGYAGRKRIGETG